MLSIRLLEEQELWGKDDQAPLSAIQTYGKGAGISNLATLLGGSSIPFPRTAEGQYNSYYLTQTAENGLAKTSDKQTIPPNTRNVVVRPVIVPAEMPFADSPETMYPLRLGNGKQIGVCQYGEYPQTYIGEAMSKQLEKLWQQDHLPETGRNYTFAKNDTGKAPQTFETEKYPEYRLDNQRYVRLFPHFHTTEYRSFNGEAIVLSKPYWVRVEPIEWLMDDSGILIAKQGLIAGVPLLQEEDASYTGDFRRTTLSQFLRQNFVPEAGVKVKTFEHDTWLREHPDPGKRDFLSVPEGEDKNVVNLLIEAGESVLRQAFQPSKWTKDENKQELLEIFSTVDETDPKNNLTLRCLDARFQAYARKQMILKKQMQLKLSSESKAERGQ